MFVRSLKQIREKTLRDLQQIKNEAAFILGFQSKREISFVKNPKPGLNTIAIIGPPEDFTSQADGKVIAAAKGLERVVLDEIGIGRTDPYHRARRLRRKSGDSYEIPGRQKWFKLTRKQYEIVAPLVFNLIEVVAYLKIRNRKTSDVWIRGRWSSDRMQGKRVKRVHSVSFSVSLKDEFFLQDVCWAESNLNLKLKRRIKYLVDRLTRLCHFSRRIMEPKIKEALYDCTLAKRHLWELMHRLKEERPAVWLAVADVINWENPEEPKEHTLASLAIRDFSVEEVKERLQGIQLRITTGLDVGEDHIVFEVYPRSEVVKEK